MDTLTPVSSLTLGDRTYSPNMLADLQVVGLTYAVGTDVAAVIAGDAEPESAVLSQDGRHWVSAWHEGPSADQVYVERREADGVAFHGWVDATTRRLVQAG